MSLMSESTSVQIPAQKSKFQFVVGISLLIVALIFALPGDLFTSGLFFDKLGMQPVFTGNSPLFGPNSAISWWRGLPEISYEATGFTLFLFCFNLAMSIKVSSAGKWARNADSLAVLFKKWRKGETVEKFNHIKAWLFVAYVVGNMLDTFFDTDFRAWGGIAGLPLYLKSFAVSFAYYSMGSEWALVEGSKWAWGGLGGIIMPRIQQETKKKKPTKNSPPARPPKNNQRRRGKRQQVYPHSQPQVVSRDPRDRL